MQPSVDSERLGPAPAFTEPRRTPRADSKPAACAVDFVLERRLDAKLWLVRGAHATPVEIVRCFPWSRPDQFLSLRDADNVERGFIADLAELDPGSRSALQVSLARSGFVLEVTHILQVSEDFELRTFEVETQQGSRRFQTALDAWPRELESGGFLLQDVYGDLYRVTPSKLDAQSQRFLRAFVD